MPEKRLERSTLVRALRAVGSDLGARGVRGQLFLAGGAVIAFAYSPGPAAAEIAEVFAPKALIHQAAARVAAEMGLPDDWLNAGVRRLLSDPDPSAVPPPLIEGIEVSTASPRYLLALKLLAARFGEDREEILTLLAAAGVAGTVPAVDLLQHLFAGWKPPLGTRLFLAELLGPPSPARSGVPPPLGD